MILLETDPAKLRNSRILQLVEFALETLHLRGWPTSIQSFIAYIAHEARLRFWVSTIVSFEYAEIAGHEALRQFKMESA